MRGLRRPTLDESIQGFSAVILCGGGLIGTGVSVLLQGGLLVGLFQLWQGRYRLAATGPVAVIGAAFVLVFLADAIAAAIHFLGWPSLIEVVENIPFLAFPVLYASLARISRRQGLEAVTLGAGLGGIGCGIWAAVEVFIAGGFRAEGMAGNPGPFGVVNAVLYGLCLSAAIPGHGLLRRIALAGALGAAAAVILSGMRSLLPMLVVAPVVLLVVFRGDLPRLRIRVVAAATAAVLLAAALAFPLVSPRIERAFHDIGEIAQAGDYDNSLGMRLIVWRAGLDLIRQAPVLGHGPGREAELIREATRTSDRPVEFSHFHNFVIHAWVRSGLLGVFACLAVLLAPVWFAARQRRDDLGNAGLAMVLCIVAAYGLAGATGLLFGHDITDALFVYGLVASLHLVFGGADPRRAVPSGVPMSGAPAS